jgi:hypothetical protein
MLSILVHCPMPLKETLKETKAHTISGDLVRRAQVSLNGFFYQNIQQQSIGRLKTHAWGREKQQ